MIIKKIQIKNYRSILDSGQLEITKLFALIGKNNCGKSAIIDAVQAFWGIKEKEIKAHDFHKDQKQDISISVTVAQFNPTEIRSKYSKDDLLEIEYIFSNETMKGEYFISGKKVPAKDIKQMLPDLLCIPAIRNPLVETTAGAKSFLKELTASLLATDASQGIDINKVKEKKAHALEIHEINALLEEKTKQRLEDISTKLTGYFQDGLNESSMTLGIEPQGDIADAISFSTKLFDPNLGEELKKVDILRCGTGLQSMAILALLQTYADLDNHPESVMLIEEPEVYLHPELQRKMFRVLREIAKETQVIYTTHSPVMISELWAKQSVRLVRRENGITQLSSIEIADVISELGIKYEDVLNPKVIVFVEGDEDKFFLEALLFKINPELYENLERFVKFIPSDGYRNIHAFALMKIIKSDNVEVPFFVLADGDGFESKERAKHLYDQILTHLPTADSKKDLLDKIHILSQYEIEANYLDCDIIANIYPEIDKSKCEKQLKFYSDKYKAAYEESQKTKKKDSVARLRPSILFERIKNQNRIEALTKLYDANNEFVQFREQLANKWSLIKKEHLNPAMKLLHGIDVKKKPHLEELIQFLEKVIKLSSAEASLANKQS